MTIPQNEFCLRIKDGKILIAHKGKPFFREPLEKDVHVLHTEEECFLVGPYPQYNTMIMPLNQYHKMLMEIKNNCPNARSWRFTALVFIGMFIIMIGIYLQQIIFSRNIIMITWKKLLSRKNE